MAKTPLALPQKDLWLFTWKTVHWGKSIQKHSEDVGHNVQVDTGAQGQAYHDSVPLRMEGLMESYPRSNSW